MGPPFRKNSAASNAFCEHVSAQANKQTWPPQIKILEKPKDLVTGLTATVYFGKGCAKRV